MKTKKNDMNQEFSLRENFCKSGVSPDAIAYLPAKHPVAYKIRVAELYARYKMFPFAIRNIPELGLCIIFIPFTYELLGQYNAARSKADQKFLQYWIRNKVPKRKKLIHKKPRVIIDD